MIALLVIAGLTLTYGIGWLVGYESARIDHNTTSRRKKGHSR